MFSGLLDLSSATRLLLLSFPCLYNTNTRSLPILRPSLRSVYIYCRLTPPPPSDAACNSYLV